MSENIDNRWFYKFSEEEYKIKGHNHIKIITRLNPDHEDHVKLFQELFPGCKFARKKRIRSDPEKVNLFEWDLTPYDNSCYGDEYNYISFAITSEDNVEEFFNIIKSNFHNHYIRKASDYTYTLKIDCILSIRGVWRNKNQQISRTKFPIAILSFERSNDYGRTHKFLTKLNIPHYLFVEPFEYELYENWYDNSCCRLIIAPTDFHKAGLGSTPIRNYILDFFKNDHQRVWLLDDNIESYKRLYKGVKNVIHDIEIFTSIENYVDRYTNVGIASHNFSPFVFENGIRNILCKNTKCYSSLLCLTNNEIRFKHKHQEDNFISIEYISKGYTNLCFNHIVYHKYTSGIDNGGNSTFIYKKNAKDIGRKERYDYTFETTKRLINQGEIKLKKGLSIHNFIFHKPLKHEYYHVHFNYEALENYSINDISRNKNPKIIYKSDLFLDTNEYENTMSKSKSKYNFESLNAFCVANNIKLSKDYKNVNLTRDTRIECICNLCSNQLTKSFRRFYDNFYCKSCSSKQAPSKKEVEQEQEKQIEPKKEVELEHEHEQEKQIESKKEVEQEQEKHTEPKKEVEQEQETKQSTKLLQQIEVQKQKIEELQKSEEMLKIKIHNLQGKIIDLQDETLELYRKMKK